MVRQQEALVPAPLYRGMRDGKIVRFEEITRTPLEVQDCLLGMLSDRVMTVPNSPVKPVSSMRGKALILLPLPIPAIAASMK